MRERQQDKERKISFGPLKNSGFLRVFYLGTTGPLQVLDFLPPRPPDAVFGSGGSAWAPACASHQFLHVPSWGWPWAQPSDGRNG